MLIPLIFKLRLSVDVFYCTEIGAIFAACLFVFGGRHFSLWLFLAVCGCLWLFVGFCGFGGLFLALCILRLLTAFKYGIISTIRPAASLRWVPMTHFVSSSLNFPFISLFVFLLGCGRCVVWLCDNLKPF